MKARRNLATETGPIEAEAAAAPAQDEPNHATEDEMKSGRSMFIMKLLNVSSSLIFFLV